jgi:hypothetical protein
VENVTVTSTTTGETIYEARWEIETIEGEDLLFWIYDVEPQDPTPGETLQIQVDTSGPMQWVSVTLPGQSAAYLVEAPDSQGMIWEGTITPSASDDETLTIQGQDLAENPLLAFSETQPDAFPGHLPKLVPRREASGNWPAAYETLRQDTSGDRLHRLGTLPPPPTWTITTPFASLCEEDQGGVVCTFDDGREEGDLQGRVAVLPDVPDPPPENESIPQFVFLPAADQPSLMHTGLYSLPEEGLKIVVQPQGDWFGSCTPDDHQEARCLGSDPTAPGHKDPPPDSTELKTLSWNANITEEADRCRIQVTWGSESAVVFVITGQTIETLTQAGVPAEILAGLTGLQDQPFATQDALWQAIEDQIQHEELTQYTTTILDQVETQDAVVTIEFQPAAVCEGLSGDESGTLEAEATCTWQETEMINYVWEDAGEVSEPGRGGNRMNKYITCQGSWGVGWRWFLGRYSYGCAENPDWEQRPEDIDLSDQMKEPGEPGFHPYQLTRVQYLNCEWDERDVWLPPIVDEHGMPLSEAYLEAARCSGTWYLQVWGWNACDILSTYRQWTGIANCWYDKYLGALTILNDQVTFTLSPNP